MVLDQNVIDRILRVRWLQNCGDPCAAPTIQCVRAPGGVSFTKAAGNAWENIKLEARGDVTSYLALHAKEAFNPYWNPLVRQVRSKVLPQVEPAIRRSTERLKLPECVNEEVKFDVINMAVVLSYRKIIGSPFYEDLLTVYSEGFLPCGWDGAYPAGRMVVL